MNSNFMTTRDLIAETPWGATTVGQMIKAGIFKPIRNPLAKKGQMFFWRPSVEKAICALEQQPEPK